MTVLTMQPKNRAQVTLLTNLAKQLGINCYTKQVDTNELTAKDKAFLKKIQTAGQEARDIISGKSKGLTEEEFFQ